MSAGGPVHTHRGSDGFFAIRCSGSRSSFTCVTADGALLLVLLFSFPGSEGVVASPAASGPWPGTEDLCGELWESHLMSAQPGGVLQTCFAQTFDKRSQLWRNPPNSLRTEI